MKQKAATALLALALGVGAGREGWAWGATGHEWISGIAIERLPDSLPDFVRTTEAAAEIAVMGRELDRSKGTGKTHDAERDPGALDRRLADDGSVVGVLPLAELPQTREDYDTLLRAKGFTQYKAGYLPYSIVDGWQQVAQGLRLLARRLEGRGDGGHARGARLVRGRSAAAREAHACATSASGATIAGDASQPMHVSVHFSGWGNFPNPERLQRQGLPCLFRRRVREEQRRARRGGGAKSGPIAPATARSRRAAQALLLASLAQVGPLYALEKDGGLEAGRSARHRLRHGAARRRRQLPCAT